MRNGLCTGRSIASEQGRIPTQRTCSALGILSELRVAGIKFTIVCMVSAFLAVPLFAKVTGSISGTAKDSQGAVVREVSVELRNVDTGVVQTIQTDSAGFYNFPAVPVGHYVVIFRKTGFEDLKQTNVVVNVDTTLQVDARLQVGSTRQEVTVSSTAVEIDTRTEQIGEVISDEEMMSLPLNGRSYTDLLALQPGVVPIQVAQYGSLSPSNSLNNGLLSIGGARDVNSGFMVNGANTVEGFGSGTTLVPNLDSIAEFRIITSNAGAEYGNYAGGQVNVVTKSGTNSFHGNAFEFLRNSSLDARNYFSPTRAVFRQNQFGGTFGGPILRNKAFFFVDYQGTRQTIGVDTGLTQVPSAAERTGDFSAGANPLSGAVNGSYWASVLSGRLGYAVSAGEPYYTGGCISTATCVFPNGIIPQAAWSPVSANVIPLIPAANQGSFFTTSANSETLRDNKGGIRVDANTHYGTIAGYYHNDPWTQISPYSGFGSSVPGFPSESLGKAQLFTLNHTISIGPNAVNQFTASYTRNKNISGLVGSGAGPSLSSLGFAAPQNGGVFQLSTQYQNWPVLFLNNFSLGAPGSIVSQYNNTYQVQDDFTKVIGTHTLKFGGSYHWDQILIAHPNNASNGGFGFSGSETGSDFADMLIGAPDFFFQGSPASLALRGYYLGAYAEDSWRATPNLTLNYGVRWEVDPYWKDSNHRNPVNLLGRQSTYFPNAPRGLVFPGLDPGVPSRMAYTRWNDFGPRFGFAYSPHASTGFLHAVLGDHGMSSIRGGFGQYYTNIEGANTFNFAAPPWALFYQSPAPPLFDAPFITRASGQNLGQRFPVPPVTAGQIIDWSQFEPISGNRNPLPDSPSPYAQHIDLSLERQLTGKTLLSISYVGTFGHHLVLNADNNPGNPALCLSVSQTSQVTDGVTCGPFGENGTYHPVSGGTIVSTRGPFGPLFSGNGDQLDVGNSSYNALETTLRHTGGRSNFLVSYTYSKAMDDGSGFGDQVILNPNGTVTALRGLSIYDMTHNFAASYTVELPFDKLFGKSNQATRGWKISGITQFTSGLPITIMETDDQSLHGNNGNSAFFGSTDEPNYTAGAVLGDTNPRHGKPYFNTSLFSQEPLGQQGTARRRFFHGPGLNNWNLSLLKDVRFTESKSLELRAEFFNVFNHAQFYGPFAVDGNLSDGPGSFGTITNAADPRIGQLGIKFMF
jgi:hypothetical protein